MVAMRFSPASSLETTLPTEPGRARIHLHRRPTCWPVPTQETLIGAAAGDALEATAAWERSQTVSDLDPRLLPQVYCNLTRHGCEDARDVKSHYDAALEQNQGHFARMSPVLRGLHLAGIPTLLLHGVALSLAVYRDPGARPIRDFQVLVPADEADRALDFLAEKGWRSLEGRQMGLTEAQRRYRHAMHLVNATGQTLRLYWHLLAQSRTEKADEEFWKQAWPVCWGEERSLVLAPTHQLLHTCAQSLSGDPQWAVDALILIRQCKIDWEELLRLARRHDLVLLLGDALGYLQHAFHTRIPRSVVWRLDGEPVQRGAEMEYRCLSEPLGRHGPVVRMAQTYRTYWRGTWDLSLTECLKGFPAYLADRAQLPGVSSLPGYWLGATFQRKRHDSVSRPSIGSP